MTEGEVREVRHYVKSALVSVITNDRFKGMQATKDFDAWLEEQLISEAAKEQPESEQSTE